MTLQDIIAYASLHPIPKEQVEELLTQDGITVDAFCDGLAREIAHGYAEGRYTYAVCDNVLDHVFRCLTVDYHHAPSDYAYAVFDAFEEGEYHHPADPLAASAEDLYTRPRIAQIIAGEQSA